MNIKIRAFIVLLAVVIGLVGGVTFGGPNNERHPLSGPSKRSAVQRGDMFVRPDHLRVERIKSDQSLILPPANVSPRNSEELIIMPRKKQVYLEKEQIVSAQVVLHSVSGASIRSQRPITSENIKDYSPSAETASIVAQAFATAGFEVGPVVGNSFSITAPAQTFEKMFAIRLRLDERGGIKAVGADNSTSLELPLQGLSKTITDNVEAITFTSPPDFGPTEFMP